MFKYLFSSSFWTQRGSLMALLSPLTVPIVVAMFSTAFLQWLPVIIFSVITSAVLIAFAIMVGTLRHQNAPHSYRESRSI